LNSMGSTFQHSKTPTSLGIPYQGVAFCSP
jgi:hypothetical protein